MKIWNNEFGLNRLSTYIILGENVLQLLCVQVVGQYTNQLVNVIKWINVHQ